MSVHRDVLTLVHESEALYLCKMIDDKSSKEELEVKSIMFQEIRDRLQCFNNIKTQINDFK